MDSQQMHSISAIQDFRQARQQAALAGIVSRLTGRSDDLLSYDDVRQKLHARVSSRRELRDIPLNAIVGSVGRYTDFNRQFLPRNPSDVERWARVKVAMTDLSGVPPIEVYQIGEAYFVIDGNHRVSVARDLGASHIQAYVTEVRSRVPLSASDSPDDLIHKAEYADFLEWTNLGETRPAANLAVTLPGQYQALANAIEAQRLALSASRGHEVSVEAAAADWYDNVYLPVVQVIREQHLLADFPERTETDMYGWLSRHRSELHQQLGWEIGNAEAARDLAQRFGRQAPGLAERLGKALLSAVTPDVLESGPPVGEWRKERYPHQPANRLAADILVPVNGEEVGWFALEQALVVARHEGGRVAGLHVVASEAELHGAPAQAVRAEFDRRCAAAGVAGNLVLQAGRVTDVIAERARWNDLIIVNLAHPPGTTPIAWLRSGFRTLVQRSPRPIMATPGVVSPLSHALLAYDGSPMANEALFLATYLALRWSTELVVASIAQAGIEPGKTQVHARQYLEAHGVQARYVSESGPVATTLLALAAAHGCDLLLMGGYGTAPLFGVVLGSAVDQVLRESKLPVLICR